jgi:hypothetical protein
MQLTLTSEEADALREVLTAHLAELRVEIGRTDHREFRERLREQDELFERILARLGAEAAPSP